MENEKAIDFLREKKILAEDKTQWIVKFSDGKEIDICDLFTEFKKWEKPKAIIPQEKILGRKCTGFKFPDNKFGDLVFNREMEQYVGQTGVLKSYSEILDSYAVQFDNGDYWSYPAKLVVKNLV